jgi:formylmethanofuran dehydrogenase subunit E
MKIGRYSFEEYIENVKSFHGSVAPGMIIGGFMVDLAQESLPEGEFFDVICETWSCLPDSVQLLTPCTIGNGWMRILDLGRYAMTFYEKYGGEGVRVYLDPTKVEEWPEIKSWFFRLKPKREQDMQLLLRQIQKAGKGIFSIQRVRVKPDMITKESKGSIVICSRCNEAYPARDGNICRACQGESPYLQDNRSP